ncbi:MAG: PAS domain S-box protein [Acidobacteria bacterium]|nr:PAS domain S-box protein [Acidobacteriota bacterium]
MDKLRASEERYRIIFENSVCGVFVSTADGVFTDVNASGCRLLGYEPGALAGKSIIEVLAPPEVARFFDARESLLAGEAIYDEWTLLKRDGSPVETEASSQMLPDGRLLAFVRNITERKKAENMGKRQFRHTALRAEVQVAFSSGGSLPSVLQSVTESIVRHLDAAFVRVWLIDEKTQILELRASAGIYTHIDGPHSRFKVGQYKIGKIAALKQFFFSNSILEIEMIDKAWATREGLVSFAGFPLIVNDKVVGVVGMFSRRLLTDDALEAFEASAALIAQGVVRKQAEDELREKQALLQAFFDISTELIQIKDVAGRCIMTNRAFQETLGLSGEDCYGKTTIEIWEAVSALRRNSRKMMEDYRDSDLEAFNTGKTSRKEDVLFIGDDERVFSTIKSPLYDAAGKPYVIFSISTDVTERRRAENKLRAEQQLLQSIIENSTALIHVQDLDNRVLLVNRNFAELLRLEPEQMIGKTEYELWELSPVAADKTEIADFRAFDAEALTAGMPLQKEMCISLIGDEKRYFLTTKSLLRDEEGNPHSICTVATDISEIKRAEKELRASQQLLQTIFDNTPAQINVKDLNGRFLITNRAFEQNLGLSRETLLGKTLYDIWKISPFKDESRDKLDAVSRLDEEALKEEKAIQNENVTILAGEERTYLVTKCALKYDTGEPYSILTIATDFTEMRRAEKELRRLQAELAHAARVMTMGALTTTIAHEVNQPLAAVVMNGNACLRWLAIDPPNLEEARNAVNRIIRDGIRAGEVIERARGLLKKSPSQKRALDINDIVKETAALAQYEIQKNEILLETRYATDLPIIEGDKIQLQQVLLNLLMNGIDAIKAAGGGDARLSVETRQKDDDHILVAVKDSGIGLKADEPDRIFESFYTTKKDGMGMGLSISRSIIEAHGGRLWAAANEPKGAAIQFALPVGIRNNYERT